MIHIGIDNGLTGAGVTLSECGKIIDWWLMPTFNFVQPARKTTSEKKLTEVCGKSLLSRIDSLDIPRNQIMITFEECPYHAQMASIMRSMAISAGKILAVMESRDIPHRRIISTDWQSPMLGNVPTGKTKEYAEARAKQIWPDFKWPALKPKGKKLHDGVIDAALIAEYGRTTTTKS